MVHCYLAEGVRDAIGGGLDLPRDVFGANISRMHLHAMVDLIDWHAAGFASNFAQCLG
jgi:hypothetical protein